MKRRNEIWSDVVRAIAIHVIVELFGGLIGMFLGKWFFKLILEIDGKSENGIGIVPVFVNAIISIMIKRNKDRDKFP